MTGKLSLNGIWKIKGTDGRRGTPASYCAEAVDERTFLQAKVPGEVHLDLVRQGIIQDPRVAMHALQARWVEELFWIYRRTFTPPKEALSQRSWLVFQGLDLAAEIYLNGQRIGTHANAFRPCRIEVSEFLREGENTLAVCLESGLYHAGERPGLIYQPGGLDAILHKRMWLRKPQYQFGWDWNPRLVNVGIYRPVWLEWADTARFDQVSVYPELSRDHRQATVHIRAHIENVTNETLPVTLVAELAGPEGNFLTEEKVSLPPGPSTQELEIQVQDPLLWWPRPHGLPILYTLSCKLFVEGQIVDSIQRRTGIRSVEIDRSPHPTGGEHFTLRINGKPIFAKGGNWVPADMIYAAPDKERYRQLINLAVQANFNTLRIWGGGLYADHDLLDLCDEAGLLVWHDFIFACAQYPSDDPSFLRDVREEITYIVRELSPHPSLAVWCGNNEIEWGAWDWHFDTLHAHPDHALYHLEIPRILQQEDPSRPYWPSSPYSPPGHHPNAPTMGDQHPWHVTLGENRENFWAYRSDESRFPNEGGALGLSSLATLYDFLPPEERYYLSPSWLFHDNEMCERAQGFMGEEWFQRWLGWNPAEMTLEDYAFYSGVLQAEALVEYISNFRRRMFSTSSAIFWMYNDSWPVTHGWTIVDYYLRRKLAYHPVRRAFDPIQIIPAIEGDKVLIIGVNETHDVWRGEARFGLARFDGSKRIEQLAYAELAPNAATVIAHFPLSDWEKESFKRAAAYAVLWHEGRVFRQNRLLLAPYKEISWAKPNVKVWREGDQAIFKSDVFVWGVCLDPLGEQDLPDDLFDLLPGLPWSIPWPQDKPLPKIARIASAAFGQGERTSSSSDEDCNG
ncbi:MAG: hypothetical protein J7M05_13215 [Anaerolineae bacterium]|nr:hypothetical protein [Anaerolineae bacterium]